MTAVDTLIGDAYDELGKPYVYGDEGPNDFDCSGLMQYVFAKVGIQLPRTADAQYRYTKPVTTPLPGDLVFQVDGTGKATHVQLYIGGGKVIQAPHTGANVEVSPLGSESGHTTHYGRVPGLGAATAPIIGTVANAASTVSSGLGSIVGGATSIVYEAMFGALGLALIGFGIYKLSTAKKEKP